MSKKIIHYSIAVHSQTPDQFVPGLDVTYEDNQIARFVAGHRFYRDTIVKIQRDIQRDVSGIQSHFLLDNPAHVDKCARTIIEYYQMTQLVPPVPLDAPPTPAPEEPAADPDAAGADNTLSKSRRKPAVRDDAG